MKYMTKKVGLVVLSLVSATVFSACSSYTVPYRTYYLDASCHYFYVDGTGTRVYDGKYVDNSFVGLKMQQDSHGRWFYQDNLGNRVYKSERCHH